MGLSPSRSLDPGQPPSESSDAELVVRVLAGERSLYTTLVRRHNQRLYRAARAILRADDDARDVVQQTWVMAFRKLSQWRGDAPFAAWITRIAINDALARKRHTAVLGEPVPYDDEAPAAASSAPSPEDSVAREQLREVLEMHIDGLPELYRTVFVLREVQGLDTAETAICLEASEEAVRVRLHRARQLLRTRLSAALGRASIDAYHFDGARCDAIVAAVSAELGL